MEVSRAIAMRSHRVLRLFKAPIAQWHNTRTQAAAVAADGPFDGAGLWAGHSSQAPSINVED